MTCKICQSTDSKTAYYGDIRGGGKETILECLNCKVQYLENYSQDYESGYREEVVPDELGRHLPGILAIANSDAIADKTVMDIGASSGTYMGGVAPFAKRVLGIEPNKEQREELSGRFKIYASVDDAILEQVKSIDTVTLWHVIEHIDDPVTFLFKASRLLKDNGRIYLSTPNLNDILMKIVPSDFPQFFYRKWHSHYYSVESLCNMTSYAGLSISFCCTHHSFGIGNAFGWCLDREPGKGIELPNNDLMDITWKNYLANMGMADTLYAVCVKTGGLH